MTLWQELISRLVARDDLSSSETSWAMNEVMSGETPPTVLAGFLMALATKGETTDEIRGLADEMLAHATPIRLDRDSVDIVGTGGDRFKTVNVSTMAALVIAATGVKVVKHGNRASTSASGSADCLEQLGVNLNQPVEKVVENFDSFGIAFLFANLFHPSMRHAAVARRDLGVPTAFNVLGPLTNPARPRSSAIGVAPEKHAPTVAGVLAKRGTSALVFRGVNGMDEISSVATNQIWEVRDGDVEYQELDATDVFGVQPVTIDDLRGGDAAHNAQVARDVFTGQPGPIRDIVAMNAAAGLVAHGGLTGEGNLRTRLKDGFDLANRTLDSGAVTTLVENWSAATA